MPVTRFHSVMLSPDSVRRVSPPTITMLNTSPEMMKRWVDMDGLVKVGRSSVEDDEEEEDEDDEPGGGFAAKSAVVDWHRCAICRPGSGQSDKVLATLLEDGMESFAASCSLAIGLWADENDRNEAFNALLCDAIANDANRLPLGACRSMVPRSCVQLLCLSDRLQHASTVDCKRLAIAPSYRLYIDFDGGKANVIEMIGSLQDNLSNLDTMLQRTLSQALRRSSRAAISARPPVASTSFSSFRIVRHASSSTPATSSSEPNDKQIPVHKQPDTSPDRTSTPLA